MRQQLSNLAQPRKLAFQHRQNNGKVITITHCKDNANNPVERLPSTHYHLITALGSVSGEEIMQRGEWTMSTEKEATEGGVNPFPGPSSAQSSTIQHNTVPQRLLVLQIIVCCTPFYCCQRPCWFYRVGKTCILAREEEDLTLKYA